MLVTKRDGDFPPGDGSPLCRFGQPVRRFEDDRFLTGRGRYVSDMRLPGTAVARILRSPHAAGHIRRLDATEARRAPGVVAVLTAAELAEDGLGSLRPFARRKRADGTDSFIPSYGLLARDSVRHVGEAVAMVVAESAAEAEAALELIALDIAPTAAVTETRATTAPGAPAVWPEEPGNVCFVERLGDHAAADAAFAAAAHVVEEEFTISRVAASPMETRSAIGVYDPETESYTLHAGLQTPHMLRNEIAANVLGIAPERLRVVSPDVGGGFGLKASAQRELGLVLWAARRVGRPVAWVSGRSESFLADHHARDNLSKVALALDGDGKFLALRLRATTNLGAYIDSFGLTVTVGNLGGLAGPYRIGAFDIEMRGVFSHTQPIAPYRGAGRPEATYCIERIVDAAARSLGIDPVELRRRNMIPAAAMPYDTGLVFCYDCGEFEKTMEIALARADWPGRASRAAAAAARGRLHGTGIAYAVECASGPPNTPLKESAEIGFNAEGHATLLLGTHNHGQGHETAFRQLAESFLGLAPDQIDIRFGDTGLVREGIGTFGSRSLGTAGAAFEQAAELIVAAARPLAAEMLEAAASDVEFTAGHFAVRGTDHCISLPQVAAKAAAEGDGLHAYVMAAPENCTFPNGCHVCEVEIDPETGAVELTRYTVADDVGRVLNPLLLEGQIHGGVAQGAGQVLLEEIAYDGASGQLLSGSLMDYALPRAGDLPMIAFAAHEVPTGNTPFGMKGAGEAGTVGSLAATANAVLDALAKAGVSRFDMPATPARVWRAIQDAKKRATT
jgi:carbon-monoxide dehydrogenase large subunit